MTKMVTRWLRRALFIAAIPSLLGLVLALASQSSLLANPLLVWHVTVDLGTLVLIAGLMLSGLGWMGSWLSWYWLRRNVKTLIAERKRQDEAHWRFIRRLDHEMKNPLAVLQVSLASLGQQPPPDGSENQPLGIAREQIARLRRLIQGLRKLADLETYPIDQESVDVAELLSKAIAAARSISSREGRSVSLRTQQVPWSPAPVMGDQDLLLLAFYNLIDNALKFTTPEDIVEVRIGEDSSAVTVEVADNGPGIPEAALRHIFEELYRGENGQGTEGSGLGLALVKKIIERHGGRVTVRSRLGQGTVFTVCLPVR